MTQRSRANGEGSIYPYRNGYAAYVWITTPTGRRQRKYVYGKSREEVHGKWLTLHDQARNGPVASKVPTVATYLGYWLREVIEPNRAPLTYATYETFTRLYIVPGIGARRLDRLTSQEVQTWLNRLARTCQCCARARMPPGPRARGVAVLGGSAATRRCRNAPSAMCGAVCGRHCPTPRTPTSWSPATSLPWSSSRRFAPVRVSRGRPRRPGGFWSRPVVTVIRSLLPTSWS